MLAEDNFVVGEIIISPQHNSLTKGQHSCRLQPKVMAVLVYLYTNHKRVVNQDELLEHVWEGRVVSPSSIQKSVNALRSAFAELDNSHEYVVYFSKRGYQLVAPHDDSVAHDSLANQSWYARFHYFLWLLMILIVGSILYGLIELNKPKVSTATTQDYVTQFNQVKPYISNIGQDSIVEPYSNSERVAYIRNSLKTQKSLHSQLIIQSTSGHEWLVSSARGQFVELAWSASGRNLVAIDRYSSQANEYSAPEIYYTFHIYTLDFKGEKVIEKNLLSYWQGKITSITWWDEATLEFVATQTLDTKPARYHYHIVDQNLSKLAQSQNKSITIVTQIFNHKIAELNQLGSDWQVKLFDAQQKLLTQRRLTFQVVSMSWLIGGHGVLLLADDNQLFILTNEGSLQEIEYSPQINGTVTRARFSDADQSLILTVVSPIPSQTRHLSKENENVLFNNGAVKYTANQKR